MVKIRGKMEMMFWTTQSWKRLTGDEVKIAVHQGSQVKGIRIH